MKHSDHMKRFLNYKFYILSLFLFWRALIFLAALLSIYFLPRFSNNFLGGGFGNYINHPFFWGWSNFDGEHYLSIAQNGYKSLQQAFFPGYPLLIRFISGLFGNNLISLNWAGIIVSNTLFFLSLFIFYKIVRLDFKTQVARYSLIALLVFPTSFYFAAVYTESLFLFTSLLTYYFFRKEKYFASGAVGIIMTATRVYGVFVLAMILIELLQEKFSLKNFLRKKMYWLGLSVLGIGSYMYYCARFFGDPLAFYSLQTIVGEQHQKGIVLLPQVFYRYLKMFVFSKEPLYFLQTMLLEFFSGVLFTILPIWAFIKKIKLSYIVYILLGFLAPSIQGSFSSVPRYLLVVFPAFIVLGIILSKLPKLPRLVYFILSFLWLMINTGLFFRGYWIA